MKRCSGLLQGILPRRLASWCIARCGSPRFAMLCCVALWCAVPGPASAAAPVTLQDDTGQPLQLAGPPMRIISMAPHLTELLFAAGGGARIVGTVNYSDYPRQALSIPRIGDSDQIDVERIIALRPDLIVVWQQGGGARQVEQLRRLGIPLFFSRSRTLDEIAGSLQRLGALMGTDAVAGLAADRLRVRLAALTARHASAPPVRVFYQIWDRPLYTLSGAHIVTDALRICGAVNVFADLKAAAPMVSIEAVLQADPELVVGTSESSGPAGGVNLWKAYPVLRATRQHNLVTVDGNLINRAGPRMVDGTAALCERVDEARRHRLPTR